MDIQELKEENAERLKVLKKHFGENLDEMRDKVISKLHLMPEDWDIEGLQFGFIVNSMQRNTAETKEEKEKIAAEWISLTFLMDHKLKEMEQ